MTQSTLELPVRVVDTNGKPVPNARLMPWALRCSQGHGLWQKGDKRAQLDPVDIFTDAAGTAAVLYPPYRDLAEGIRTISVSLHVDHPDFAFAGGVHIDVPLETDGPHVVELTAGVSLEIQPTIDGAAADLENIFVLWSDGRSWQPSAAPTRLADGALRIPAMRPGKNSVLLVRLEGDRATYFSQITEFKLLPDESKRIDVPLRPSMRIQGMLSDNVPRPVRAGRVKIETLEPADAAHERVSWFSWAPIGPDGTFMIDGWPAKEPMQLIALCEGYMATSGRAPDCVKNPLDPNYDPFSRPQVFNVDRDGQIEVAMTPLARCAVKVVDEDGKPVAGVSVAAYPNVCWWNAGSQVYCHPLVRGERLLRQRNYQSAAEAALSRPFEVATDAEGKVTLELPAGNESLALVSDDYELAVFLGRRSVDAKLTRDETTAVVLHVLPKGTEKLGEWDKLAGVVFGCSTREGRRICALPAVQQKMQQFAERFREAKDQRNPQLLSEAYSAVADAFVNVGDGVEAAKWRQKANDQMAKANAAIPTPIKSRDE